MSRAILLSVAVVLALGSVGCEEAASRTQQVYWYAFPTDLVAAGKVKVEAVPGPELSVSRPAVKLQGPEIVVSGTVTRAPGTVGQIPGALRVQVLNPDGSVADEAMIHWEPSDVPTTGDRTARYSLRLAVMPQNGSTVRVAYALRPREQAAWAKPQPSQKPPATQPARATAGPHADGEWTPASETVNLGLVEIRVISAQVRVPGEEPGDGGKPDSVATAGVSRAGPPKLLITVAARNVSARRLPYATWSSSGGASLVGPAGLAVPVGNPTAAKGTGGAASVGASGKLASGELTSGQSFTDVIAFDPPDPAVKSVRLKLSGSAVGRTDEAKFEVPIPFPPATP